MIYRMSMSEWLQALMLGAGFYSHDDTRWIRVESGLVNTGIYRCQEVCIVEVAK